MSEKEDVERASDSSPPEHPTYEQTLDDGPGNWQKKLRVRGPKSLSDSELLAAIVGNMKTASRLVRRYGLSGMAELPATTWYSGEKLSRGSAARLCVVYELARRTYGEVQRERTRLIRPQDVYRQVKYVASLKKEHLVGLYLDAQNGLLHEETISVGSLNTTRTHPREILHPAIQHLALGFILAHNHPSGSLEPSREDLEFTHAIQRAGELMGIELYDHLIVTSGGFCSLRERGLL